MALKNACVIVCLLGVTPLAITSRAHCEQPIDRLAQDLAPWLSVASGNANAFSISGTVSIKIDGKQQQVDLRLERFDDEAFDLVLTHSEYAVEVRRRADSIALGLPKHNIVYLGQGEVSTPDTLRPSGILSRILGPGTAISVYAPILKTTDSVDFAEALVSLVGLKFSEEQQSWLDKTTSFQFAEEGKRLHVQGKDFTGDLQLDLRTTTPRAIDDWQSMKLVAKDRTEIERQLARGIRRTLEVLAPSVKLTSPAQKTKKIEHGELKWVDGQRVVLLHGSPEQIGEAHGKLLKAEAQLCIDSVLYAFGTVQTISTGRWFRDDLESAFAQLAPHIPERHLVETRALAASLNQDERLMECVNVFPELFHCSGFAVFGNATKDGKLYHGRVLDYMTTIGLQDAATTFIVAADGMIPFANVGYAGFIGSVSGMNVEKISLGEMGGRGEGQWNGVPMATLMRRGLEECSSLDQVKRLWQDNPRTCEYYYVFADGEDRSAVGVAATPDKLQFVAPGEAHELLGEGIKDAVVLSAGSRLEELRKRVKSNYGNIDVTVGQSLMCRPVAMESNLHNVLFVPEDGILFIANADHKQPAAERPYVRLDLRELVASMPTSKSPAKDSISLNSKFEAIDSLNVQADASDDAQQCLEDLTWEPSKFEVAIRNAKKDCGDWQVAFPSSRPSGVIANDQVTVEWYQAKNEAGSPIVAPAVVVVHESGSGMTVGRIIAKGLAKQGVHAFMIQLPFYGERRPENKRPSGDQLFLAMKQGIADSRRARDAVAAIPLVDNSCICIQGTSLGGFVTATTAGLDCAYDRVFIFLAGGDLYDVVTSGKKDAAKFREELNRNGVTDAQIKELLSAVEPLRLAHRLAPESTWMFSGQFDDVVPLKNANKLAVAANLSESHHIKMLANHYSGVIYLPSVIKQMSELIHEKPE
jgi:Acyl-coenzyme A:6-aminopenicillanic acid acyl-transferase/Prolyl oligopeptidase family